MNCRRFETWLDGGQPGHDAPSARRHVARCAACREALDASIALDDLFEVPGLTVSKAFTDRVMSRVESEPRLRGARLTPPEPLWWIESWAEPTAALALVACGLLIWHWNAVLSGIARSMDAMRFLAAGPVDTAVRLFAGITHTLSVVTLMITFGAFLAWISLLLYREVEGWMLSSLNSVVPARLHRAHVTPRRSR